MTSDATSLSQGTWIAPRSVGFGLVVSGSYRAMKKGRCSSCRASVPYRLSMTGQARAAACRRRAGDGFVTIRSAPTLIVSVPPAARAWLRLSTMSAKAFARRHSRARLSARACSRGTSCPASVRTEAARSGSHQRQLHIDQHPAAAEDRERPGPVEDHDLQLAEQIEIEVRDPGNDLHQNDASDEPEHDPGGACRARGDREEHGVGDEDGERKADGQR